MLEPVLRCTAIGYEYEPGVPAIADVSFTVGDAEVVCITGPSGSGKTTLLKAVTGLLTPTRGSVELATDRRGVGVVFQSYERSLMPWLRVQANVELPLRGRLGRAGRARRALEALVAVGLDGHAHAYPRQLSGGMQQRVAIARALAIRPSLLVMDEPFASVDAQTRADLEDQVLDLQERFGMSILIVTHDIDEAVYLADKVVVLTDRPSTVAATIEVPLPRPRDQLATKESPNFLRARHQVFDLLHRPRRHVGEDRHQRCHPGPGGIASLSANCQQFVRERDETSGHGGLTN